MARSLQKYLTVQRLLARTRYLVFTRFWGMSISETARISLRADLDKTYPRGIHIGDRTYVTFGVTILTHDRTRGIFTDTTIGNDCFIGARAMILPGVSIGDSCVVGAGAVVVRDVPSGCIVAGNPARVVKENVRLGPYGRYPDADATTHRLAAEGKYIDD